MTHETLTAERMSQPLWVAINMLERDDQPIRKEVAAELRQAVATAREQAERIAELEQDRQRLIDLSDQRARDIGALNARLARADERIQALEQDLADARSGWEAAAEQVRCLNLELASAKARALHVDIQIGVQATRAAEAERENARLSDAWTDAVSDHQQTIGRVAELEQENARLRDILQSLRIILLGRSADYKAINRMIEEYAIPISPFTHGPSEVRHGLSLIEGLLTTGEQP